MKTEKQWYILYVHAGSELKTFFTLQKKGIECFCPVSTVSSGARQKSIVNPVFPNYVFVHIAFEEQSTIRRINGVVNFMHWLGECVVVKDEDMRILKELTEKYHVLSIDKISVNVNMSATKEWATIATDGNSKRSEKEDIIKVSFPAYGFALNAKESTTNVRVISINTNKSWQSIAGLQYSR